MQRQQKHPIEEWVALYRATSTHPPYLRHYLDLKEKKAKKYKNLEASWNGQSTQASASVLAHLLIITEAKNTRSCV